MVIGFLFFVAGSEKKIVVPVGGLQTSPESRSPSPSPTLKDVNGGHTKKDVSFQVSWPVP